MKSEFYVVRQENGSLWFCTECPHRSEYSGHWTVGHEGSMVRLPGKLFPEVRCTDREPTRLEINLIINAKNAHYVR